MDAVDLSRQYHYHPNGDAYDAWNVQRLVEQAQGLPVEDVLVEDLAEIDTNYWFHAGYEPTVRNVVRHVVHATREVDLAYPVILGPDLRVMDGMHRIVAALYAGASHVRAVRFERLPPPDLRGCRLGEVPHH